MKPHFSNEGPSGIIHCHHTNLHYCTLRAGMQGVPLTRRCFFGQLHSYNLLYIPVSSEEVQAGVAEDMGVSENRGP